MTEFMQLHSLVLFVIGLKLIAFRLMGVTENPNVNLQLLNQVCFDSDIFLFWQGCFVRCADGSVRDV